MFNLEVRFLGGLTLSQQSIFQQAAERWSEIIIGDLPSISVDGEIVDDVLIEAQGVFIDGPGMVLGRAGPTSLRPGSLLPAKGIMEFDTADLIRQEQEGSLINTIIHEMGHVLGIGTIWSNKGFLVGCSSTVNFPNPVYTGENAQREFASLIDDITPQPVPVANRGGPGTRCGHWREDIFGNELMTGFLNPGTNPISRLTIAALEDLGYEVNYEAADAYLLPTSLELAIMGINSDIPHSRQCSMCGGGTRRDLQPVVLPESSYV